MKSKIKVTSNYNQMTKRQKARFHKRLGETLTILYEEIKDKDSKQRLNSAYDFIFGKIRNKS